MSVNATYVLCAPTSRVPQGGPGSTKTNCPHCGREIWVTPDNMRKIQDKNHFWGCSDCMVRMAGRPAASRWQIEKNFRIA